MSRGNFEGSIQVVAGDKVRLFQAETNQAILTRGMESDFAIFIPITARNASTRWAGRSFPVGSMLAKRPEAEYNNQTVANSVIRALQVPIDVLQSAARTLSGGCDLELPSWSEQRPSSKKLKRFQQGLDELFLAGLQAPAVLNNTEGRAIELDCLRRLIDLLTEPASAVLHDRFATDRTILVRQTVDFMNARLKEPLTAIELCAESGVSDRSLRRAFREAFGMGPLAYFRVIRLHAVRAALMRRSEANPSVAQIAHHWGFHRLGAFANEYRRQFGELPSHTLGVRGRRIVYQCPVGD